ncbi:LacI family DNA-binding transcriptional regulator [Fervidibacillus halotolerans]|uniref:LacI family transcriptional regulator n=1 Tax=Fervidibacillus halotolerans TaxID=2980027 RepID=A0A9E8RYB1_9BACI|nr:LacI family DNA-binding transcriptional regulator [Fervidibacillus halotolerans]WAA12048.1 LacI family transcriptional regulator [Fervidibacillus halotolerans]
MIVVATIKDVAKKAGVSIGVVSRAFNDYPDISEKTKQKILKIAKELNYTPNVVAKNLSSKRLMTIGMITSGIMDSDEKDSDNSLEAFKGVYTAVDESDYELAIYLIDSQKQRKKTYTQFCRERNIGGAILQGIRTDDSYFKELMNANIPCVLIDIEPVEKSDIIGSVSIDNRKAAREMAEYLLKKNHREIVIMAGIKEAYVNTERLKGVMDAFHAFDTQLSEDHILYGNFKEQDAYSVAKQYLEDEKPTAFLCFSDLMAIGVMKAIREAGYTIPDDISVTGFDGLAISEFTTPPLTTIKQNFFEIGYKSAILLKDIMEEGVTEQTKIIVDYQFIERESVKEL